VLRQELSLAVSAILTATVGMHDESCGRPTLAARHRSRLVDQLGSPMVSHGPSDHGARAQSSDDGERQPAFARRKRSHVSNIHGIWGLHRQLPLALVRDHCLGLACREGRLEPAPRFAAQPCLSQQRPKTTAADL